MEGSANISVKYLQNIIQTYIEVLNKENIYP